MASEIVVDARPFAALATRAEAAQPVVLDEMRTAMERSALAVQRRAMALAPVDTGTLRRSITRQVTPLHGRVGTNVPYAREVEFGRKPRGPLPAKGELIGWMRRKGIDVELEFVIRRAIAKRGTRAQPYLNPALEEHRAAIGREFALAADRAAIRILG